jgi:cytoskeletal protein RodZ
MARKKEQQPVDPIDAPMDDFAEAQPATVGSQLRTAREGKGLTLEDIAAQTRIPRRHLESLEISDWQRLPAPTYTMGFAKSYASAVGLDRLAIADGLRDEMGGVRPAHTMASEVFEPADPARTMPKWLVFGAIAAVLGLVLLMSWLNERSVSGGDVPAQESAPVAAAPQAGNPGAAPGVAPAQGPVVLTANAQVWLQVKDRGTTLKEGILEAGQSFEVPASAQAPVLMTGKPEAIRISVGTADAPSIGPAATTVRNVSLRGPDLLRGPGAPPVAGSGAAGQAPPPAVQRTPR